MVTICSILNNEEISETKSKLVSASTMKKWGRFRGNFYFKFVTALYAVLCAPDTDIMYKNDGTERNKENLYGHVLEFRLAQQKRDSFKKCVIDGKERDIGFFASYERNANVCRLIIYYNQSLGKSVDAIKECTEEAFYDINHYIQTWSTDPLKSQLIESFGAANLNFKPLNLRVTGFGHDRHVVKCI